MESLRLLRPVIFKLVNNHSSLHTSAVCNTIAWRESRGLPKWRNAYGPLTDLPDYKFVDGRPTPLGGHQKRRMLRNQELAKQIIKLSSEMDFAIERRKNILADHEAEKRAVLSKRLKEKGHKLLTKS